MRTVKRDLTDLDLFVAVADAGGIRPAAKRLGATVSRVSDRIRALEAQLDARLFHRSTRSLALTDAGASLLARVRPALEALDDAVGAVGTGEGEPVGRVRINAPPPAADFVLAPLIEQFLRRYPRVDVELVVEDALVDIIRSGFDLGVRYEESLSPDMIAVSIGAPQRYALVASPQGLAHWGAPHSPEDLAQLPAIRHRFPSGALLPWEFTSGERTVRIDPPARLVTNHANMEVAAAMAGCGLLLTLYDYVANPLQDGRLVALLEGWLPPFRGPFLYYFSRRQIAPPVRAFVDFVRRQPDGAPTD